MMLSLYVIVDQRAPSDNGLDVCFLAAFGMAWEHIDSTRDHNLTGDIRE